MVALYREGAVCEQLIDALDRLDWPASRLDIKLVCEADDAETLAALRARRLRPHYDIVEVPPAFPAPSPRHSPMRWPAHAANS